VGECVCDKYKKKTGVYVKYNGELEYKDVYGLLESPKSREAGVRREEGYTAIENLSAKIYNAFVCVCVCVCVCIT